MDKEMIRNRIRKILFWNVAGVGNKDRDFWNYISNFDMVNLCETWIDEKGWESLKERMPVSHEWVCSFARRGGGRGRAKGGFLIGKRVEEDKKGSKLNIRKENEEMVWCNMEVGKESVGIIMVYGGQDKGKLGDRIEEFVGMEDLSSVIVGGDFNIRIGELGNEGVEEGVATRCSKDKVIGNGGIQLVDWIIEKGGMILNGRTEGDWEGEYTYVGARGNSVIDYVIVNGEIGDKIRRFKVGERVDSDHLPLEVELETDEERTKEEDRRKRTIKEEEMEIIVWDMEARQIYRDKAEELIKLEIQKDEREVSIEERWERLKKVVNEAMVRCKKKRRRKEIGYKDWWDRSCTKKKRELKRIYRRWRRGKVLRERYVEEKRKFKLWVEKKQREKREKEEEELKKIRSETEIWSYINRKCGKKKWVENKIGKEEWRNHFMRLLDGVEEELRIEATGIEEEETLEETIEEEEIKRAMRKMKMKKAAGIDGIPMEAWRFAGEELWMDLVKLMKDIWKKGVLPKDWRKSVVVPLYKRGEREIVGNYRGISLLCTAYKIYAEILRCRLEGEVEERKLVPDSQAGFRSGRSTIDNIWVLNHLLQREKRIRDKKEEIYILFADMKAAFDNMDREILWKDLIEKGINK